MAVQPDLRSIGAGVLRAIDAGQLPGACMMYFRRGPSSARNWILGPHFGSCRGAALMHNQGGPPGTCPQPLTLLSLHARMQASNAVVASGGTALIVDRSWRAPLATCILSSLLVIGFDLMSCITLVK